MEDKKRRLSSIHSAFTGFELFFDTVEETEVRRKRKKIVKIQNYAEKIVPFQGDKQFKSHFRLERKTFRLLSEMIAQKLSKQNISPGRPTISPDKQLMIALWILANQKCFRSVADRFGVSTWSAHKSLFMIAQCLIELNSAKKIIVWPNEVRTEEIKTGFKSKYKFPGVISAIDGTYINIRAPTSSPTSYINRKGNHAIILQAICDDTLAFTDCYAGEVGSVHDACVFRRSPIFQRLSSKNFPEDNHLLGDPAYPLLKNVMVPHKQNGLLNKKQVKFNNRLSSARNCIERAFAMLKGRFRRLRYLDMSRIDMIPQIIIACCLLHNICLQLEDIIEIEEDDVPVDDHQESINDQNYRSDAVHKRNRIADQFCQS